MGCSWPVLYLCPWFQLQIERRSGLARSILSSQLRYIDHAVPSMTVNEKLTAGYLHCVPRADHQAVQKIPYKHAFYLV
jgi:hypothetical protein